MYEFSLKYVCICGSRHPGPVSTIGSVSDYDSVRNQEVAGSSPVLVISGGRLAQLVVCLTTILFGIRRLRVRAPCWSRSFFVPFCLHALKFFQNWQIDAELAGAGRIAFAP